MLDRSSCAHRRRSNPSGRHARGLQKNHEAGEKAQNIENEQRRNSQHGQCQHDPLRARGVVLEQRKTARAQRGAPRRNGGTLTATAA